MGLGAPFETDSESGGTIGCIDEMPDPDSDSGSLFDEDMLDIAAATRKACSWAQQIQVVEALCSQPWELGSLAPWLDRSLDRQDEAFFDETLCAPEACVRSTEAPPALGAIKQMPRGGRWAACTVNTEGVSAVFP